MKKETLNIELFFKDKPELKFIIDVLSKQSVITNEVRKSIDKLNQKEFVRLIKHHRLDSIFYKAIQEQNIILPIEFKTKLDVINKRNKMRMMKLTAELIRIHQLFTENGIEYISLKGPALSQQIYGDYTIRCSRDLDILVKVKDLNKVNLLLNKINYKTNTKNTTLCRYADKDIIYFNNKANVILEIHHRFFINKYLFPLKTVFIDNYKTLKINNQEIHILSDHINFLYLTSHSATHNWARMTWTIDTLNLKRELNSNTFLKIKEISIKTGVDKLFNQALNMSYEKFLKISNEKQYVLIKKFFFRLSLNKKIKYKLQEVIYRLLTPYRVNKKNQTDKLFF